MTVEMVRAEKAKAERTIQEALAEFYEKTRCPITSMQMIENGAESIVAVRLRVEV